MTLPYSANGEINGLIVQPHTGVFAPKARLEELPSLNPNYTNDMGQAWKISDIEGEEAANTFRQLRGLPLIEVGDGK
jgi:hypothetical protein